jgi:hypothetical protein
LQTAGGRGAAIAFLPKKDDADRNFTLRDWLNVLEHV